MTTKIKTYKRTQYIRRPMESVSTYLAQVENLPEWNRFFVATGANEGNRTFATTQFGLVRTRIEVTLTDNGITVVINSLLRGREETARVELSPLGANTVVHFHLSLPMSMPRDSVEEMLADLETNLATLASILENRAEPAACA
jgi:hypothetical protein